MRDRFVGACRVYVSGAGRLVGFGVGYFAVVFGLVGALVLFFYAAGLDGRAVVHGNGLVIALDVAIAFALCYVVARLRRGYRVISGDGQLNGLRVARRRRRAVAGWAYRGGFRRGGGHRSVGSNHDRAGAETVSRRSGVGGPR